MACACGCGGAPNAGKRYLRGHNRRPRAVMYDVVEAGHRTACWLWRGRLLKTGHGQATQRGRSRGAHIVFYEKAKGPVPVGRDLDHLCRNRACVNPDHLEPVTEAENTRRGRVAKLTPYGALSARLMAATTSLSHREIAEVVGVSRSNVSQILCGKTWSF